MWVIVLVAILHGKAMVQQVPETQFKTKEECVAHVDNVHAEHPDAVEDSVGVVCVKVEVM